MNTDELMLTLCEFLDMTRNAPLKDVVYDAFRQAITSGRIPAGTIINEKQLSQALHISRTPIRSALDQLATEQLVERKTGSGITVLGVSVHDAEETFEIRVVLETLAATKAARNMTEADFEEMRLLLEDGQRLNAAGAGFFRVAFDVFGCAVGRRDGDLVFDAEFVENGRSLLNDGDVRG